MPLRLIRQHTMKLIHNKHLMIMVRSLPFSSQIIYLFAYHILDSVMHYGRTYFSSNGLETIIPKDPTAVIGLQEKLSPIDIKEIQLFYQCH